MKAFTKGEETIAVIALRSIALSCFFVSLYQFAKGIKDQEEKLFQKRSIFILDIILIWIVPISIWFLQKRIQAILGKAVEGKAVS